MYAAIMIALSMFSGKLAKSTPEMIENQVTIECQVFQFPHEEWKKIEKTFNMFPHKTCTTLTRNQVDTTSEHWNSKNIIRLSAPKLVVSAGKEGEVFVGGQDKRLSNVQFMITTHGFFLKPKITKVQTGSRFTLQPVLEKKDNIKLTATYSDLTNERPRQLSIGMGISTNKLGGIGNLVEVQPHDTERTVKVTRSLASGDYMLIRLADEVIEANGFDENAKPKTMDVAIVKIALIRATKLK